MTWMSRKNGLKQSFSTAELALLGDYARED
jgi:hypothetical protein